MSDSDPKPRPDPRIDAIETEWTLLRRAHMGSSLTGEAARNSLVLRYASAVRNYIGAMTRDDAQADELAQDVVVRLLSGDFSGADPNRGRFRDLLKTAVRNMVRSFWQKEGKRRGVDFDVQLLEQAEADDHSPWLDAWKGSVLDNVWSKLAAHQDQHDGNISHTVLRMRVDYPDDSSEALADRVAKKTGKPLRADAMRQQLRRARVRFAELLIAELAAGLNEPTADDVEQELVSLGLADHVRGVLAADWKSKL